MHSRPVAAAAAALALSLAVTACSGGESTPAPSGAKALTAFSFAARQATGTVVGEAVTAWVYGADVGALVATFATTGASVKVNGAEQESGVTANDFSGPVAYTVTAADGSTAVYTVTVRVRRLVDSGQAECWDAAFAVTACAAPIAAGQDGAYAIAAPAFTDHGDGTVQDEVTGLVWQQCPLGQSGADCAIGTAALHNWSAAVGMTDSLNPGGTNACASLSLAGTGWRLPNDLELASILDYGRSSPAIDPTFFPSTALKFWSSGKSGASMGLSPWVVDFDSGRIEGIPPINAHHVRCVRSSPPAAAALADNGNGTVTDGATARTWQRCSAGLTLAGGPSCTGTPDAATWSAALAYCEALSFGGFDDWRLPNAKELRSIVDGHGTSAPFIDRAYFPDTQSAYYWTSTSNAADPSTAWRVSFEFMGNIGTWDKAATASVRCVR